MEIEELSSFAKSINDKCHTDVYERVFYELLKYYQQGRIDGMESLAEKLELNVNLNHD